MTAFRIAPRGALQKGEYNHTRTPEDDGGAGYMGWLHELPCCVTLQTGPKIDAHHVRLERAADGSLKSHNKSGKRPVDWQTVPLLPEVHDNYPGSLHKHTKGEADWWRMQGIDPLLLCQFLKVVYTDQKGNVEKAISVMKMVRGL